MSELTIGLLMGFGLAAVVVVVWVLLRQARSPIQFGPDGPVSSAFPHEHVERSSLRVSQHPDGRVVIERDGQTTEYARMDDVPDDVRQMIERAHQMGPGTHFTTKRTVRRMPPE